MSIDLASWVAFGIMILFPIACILYLSFTSSGKVRMRAMCIANLREKRIIKELQKYWEEENADFIRQCELENERKIFEPSSDESSTVGYYGSDSGDGDGESFNVLYIIIFFIIPLRSQNTLTQWQNYLLII